MSDQEIREITEVELPANLKDHWKSAKASVERNNPGYAIKFLQAILKLKQFGLQRDWSQISWKQKQERL